MMLGIFKAFLLSVVVAGLAWVQAPSVSAKTITLEPGSTFVLRGVVEFDNTTKLAHQILTAKSDTVHLFIDSPGGSIFAGLKLIEAIKSTDKTVVCIANTAVSMAFVILQACDERYVMDHSVLMQHMPSYGMEGQEPNNFSIARFIHVVSANLYKMQAERMGMTTKDFYDQIRNDWWMYDSEGVDNNAADSKVDVECSPALLKLMETETVRIFIFTVKLKFNACPLIAGPIEDNAAAAVPPEKRKSQAFQAEYDRVMKTFDARSVAEKWLQPKKVEVFE